MSTKEKLPIAYRFRGFLPVIVDVETGGFDANKDALLEIGATIVDIDDSGFMQVEETFNFNVKPEPGLNLDPAALEFTGINPDDPERNAISENEALKELFNVVRRKVKETGCNRAVLVGHNAFFDHSFLFAASARQDSKRNPFHPFSTFDTATLAGLAYGHTVLAKSCELAGIDFDNKSAHSAAYDAERTAELFCAIVNKWKMKGGWPPVVDSFDRKKPEEIADDEAGLSMSDLMGES